LTINGGNTFTIKTHDSSPITERQVESLLQSSFLFINQGSALSALDSLDTQLSQLAEKRGRIGASLSRIAVATNVLSAASENSAAAAARIMDADVALETAKLTRQQILQNTVSAILAQANQQPVLALSLLTQGRK
ncbi:MAG: flagellin FliC, partial [Candidatus Dadabacteria bacterium]